MGEAELSVENHICAGVASWVRGRVVSIPHRCAAMVTLGGTEHVISREQAVALGTRLLEVGIGTSFMEERAVNARIAEIISAWERNKSLNKSVTL